MTTIDLRARLRRDRARRQPLTAVDAPVPTRRRLVRFEHHESGRWLALEVFLRGHRAGLPFALHHEHGTLELTVGQLEHLVLAAGPAALARYHQQEAALLAGGLDDDPPADPRDPRAERHVVACGAASRHGGSRPTTTAAAREAARA